MWTEVYVLQSCKATNNHDFKSKRSSRLDVWNGLVLDNSQYSRCPNFSDSERTSHYTTAVYIMYRLPTQGGKYGLVRGQERADSPVFADGTACAEFGC